MEKRPICHSERSEESRSKYREMLRSEYVSMTWAHPFSALSYVGRSFSSAVVLGYSNAIGHHSGAGLAGGMMEGIQFVMDDKGQKVAVLIDLRKFGELWEDIYDSVIARLRANEPRESLASVEKRLRKQGKLHD